MEKEFIPYKEVLALKELGFDEPCLTTIQGGTTLFLGGDYADRIKNYQFKSEAQPMFIKGTNPIEANPMYEIGIPLYQQAFRWFREKYRLDGNIYECVKVSDDDTYNFRITGIKNYNFFYDIGANYISYEEAELACLRKLIEIAQNNKASNV